MLFWYTCWIGLLLVGFVKGKTCSDTTWYNSSSPADHGGSDVETVNMTVINTTCPDGGPVVAARCKDEKGEPFSGFKNVTGNRYIATCTVLTGLQCHPYNGTVGASCADFAIQYGCDCPTTTMTTKSTTFTRTPARTNALSSRHAAAREGTTAAMNKNDANTVGGLANRCRNSVFLKFGFGFVVVTLTSLTKSIYL